MTNDPSQDVLELARLLSQQAAPAGGRGRRSPLFWWMYQRADELSPLFQRKRMIWANVAAALPDIEDTRDGVGARPTGERVRKTWHEVCRAKGWTKQPASAPTPTARAVKPAQPVQPVTADPDDDEEEIEWTTADGTLRRTRIPKQR